MHMGKNAMQTGLPEAVTATAECGACKNRMEPFFRARDYNRGVSQRDFFYSRCTGCGLISLINVPDDLEKYYAPGYYLLPASEREIEQSLLHEQYKIELVQRFAKTGRLLEIGPSWGAFCLLAKRAGFSVEAIEMDRECCGFLNSRLGIRAIHSADEVASLSEVSAPDVVVMWHVIEHLRDPWPLLERAAQRLAPGGIMVLATPNPAAFQFGIIGRFWTHVDAPRHVHLIPVNVMRTKLGALGLRELLLTTRDEGSLGWNTFGWAFTLANLTDIRVVRRMFRLVGSVIALMLSPIERREGAGSAYTAVFRKPEAS